MADFRHFLLHGTRSQHAYVSTMRRGEKQNSPPRPERKTHAEKLLSDLEQAEKKAKARQKTEPAREGIQFIPMVFDESSDFKLEQEQLENTSPGARIVSAKERHGRMEFLVAVPDSEVSRFAEKFQAYRDKDTRSGKPKNEPLSSSVGGIDAGELEDYWTGAPESLPDKSKTLWWELWFDLGGQKEDVEKWFRDSAANQKILISKQQVRFPDRLVILGFGTFEQWRNFPGLLKYLAELRQANIVASEFTSLTPASQVEFINAMLQRTNFADSNSVRVCILDTGVERGHLLLRDSLSERDTQAWDIEWGSDDHSGHGTELAGICLYGPKLNEVLDSDQEVKLVHRLESVKILPREGESDPPDYGPITLGSMALAETVSPKTPRVFCMAVSAPGEDQWRPTLWSATIDQATSGALDGHRRLAVLSAGNLREEVGKNYPHENYVSSIEDPAQSWNALTVGGCTNLAWIQEEGLEGYHPIAKPGTLSPTSRTSLCWGDEPWPYKPDVVFEGGNYASDDAGFITDVEDFQILTTRSNVDGGAPLGTMRDTSAATAQAARMAAILQAEYPEYWPETIRGLVVHSAKWTPQMMDEFPYSDRRQRLRVYGMGVPDIEQARRSASGFTTMVIQDELRPFVFGPKNSTNEMHMHDLPIPREVLEDLGDTAVRMRVTLSYFIEPNPPRRGYVARYQYASCGLRFSVRRPQENLERMRNRLSRTFWDKDPDSKRISPPRGSTISDDREWDLGPEAVAVRGSIHSDSWRGTAAQLASSNLVAVYPVTGWWRYRSDPEVVERKTRYSLIVSISTDDTSVDLYSMIANEIQTRVTTDAKIVTEVKAD